MLKTGFKAFVYSFSVSLFAILTAHRAFLHDSSSDPEPLKLTNKNIVLFLKKTVPHKSPVKKIALSALPEIAPPQAQKPSIVLADAFEYIDFPLEFDTTPAVDTKEEAPAVKNKKTLKSEDPIIVADILYAPDLPQEPEKIDAEPIYQPETPVVAPRIASPKQAKAPVLAEAEPVAKIEPKTTQTAKDTPIPLQTSKPLPKGIAIAKIGSPQDLDHVALTSTSLPIESMKKDEPATQKSPQSQKKWQSLNDSPWVTAYSNAGTKNQLATKDNAAQAFVDLPQTKGVQLADETAKNIILPIPEKIMEDENLTPKLAYPRDSEDAVKEKLIDAKIQTDAEKKKEEKALLSKIDDEDISLDAPKEEPKPKPQPKPEKIKENILGKINSIFTQTTQKVTEAKDKAIAKAQARRSLKKKLAKMKPVSIMPQEIRLSFQPNKAEISGQTLRWVQAFAAKAAETTDTVLEIRIDGTSSPVLQQRRLNLLHNILANKGVEYSKINTVFTSREPNSFILRTVNIKQNDLGEKRKVNNLYAAPHGQW